MNNSTDNSRKKKEQRLLLLRERNRRSASTSLHEFVAQAWHVVEPASPFKDSWHVGAICEHLEAVHNGQIRRLLINIPPRFLKSTIASVMYPAWKWVHRPAHKFLTGSYAQKLAIRDNLKMRRLIQSQWYRERWGREYNLADNSDWGDPESFELTTDQNQKMRFENDRSGYRIAFSFDGGVMGEGGDCVSGETIVATEDGGITIKRLHEMDRKPRVWSMTLDGRLELRQVLASRVIRGRRTIAIVVDDGDIIRCTDEHRIWTPDGYVAASNFAGRRMSVLRIANDALARSRGEVPRLQRDHADLRLVPEELHARIFGTRQAAAAQSGFSGDVLAEMQRGPDAVDGAEAGVHQLPPDLPGPRAWVSVLFAKMQLCAHRGISRIQSAARQVLCSLRGGVHHSQRSTPILRESLPERGAQHQDDRRREFAFHGKPESGRIVSSDAAPDQAEGRLPLHLLSLTPGQDRVDRAPHRSQSREQRARESDNTLQRVPHDAPQVEKTSATLDDSGPGRHGEELVDVYDIQVEGNRSFFANGILVHNCVIIDDPHDRESAHSDLQRAGDLTTFREAVSTRVNDPVTSALIIIMQRLHEHDLSGYVLAQGGYEHLMLPMHYDPARSKVTVIGWKDPRTEVGELLHPQRFTPEAVAEWEATLLSAAAGQLEQRPEPAEGGTLKRDYWRYYDVLPEKFDSELQSWDLAFKGTATSNFVAGQAWGRVGANCYLKPDEVYAQLDIVQSCEAIEKFTERHPYPQILIEDKANGPAVMRLLKNKVPGMIPINPDGGAEAVANAVAPYIAAGNVWLPNPYNAKASADGRVIPGASIRSDRAWVIRFINNAAKFPHGSEPVGSHGDDVVAATQAINRLMNRPRLRVI